MNEGQLKRLLHYIFCIVLDPDHSARDMENLPCGLFAKDLERGRITAFCSDKKAVFLCRERAFRVARFRGFVLLQISLGHAATPIKQQKLEILSSCTRPDNWPA